MVSRTHIWFALEITREHGHGPWQDERWGWKPECRPNVPVSQRNTRCTHTQRMGFDISDRGLKTSYLLRPSGECP